MRPYAIKILDLILKSPDTLIPRRVANVLFREIGVAPYAVEVVRDARSKPHGVQIHRKKEGDFGVGYAPLRLVEYLAGRLLRPHYDLFAVFSYESRMEYAVAALKMFNPGDAPLDSVTIYACRRCSQNIVKLPGYCIHDSHPEMCPGTAGTSGHDWQRE